MPALQTFHGGWVLRPARHLYQPQELINATNLVPDILGSLTTRPGMTQIGSLPGYDITAYTKVYSSGATFQAALNASTVYIFSNFSTLLASMPLGDFSTMTGLVDFAQGEDIDGLTNWAYIAGFVNHTDGRYKKVGGPLRNWGIKKPFEACHPNTQIVGGGFLSAGAYIYQYRYVRKTTTTVVAMSNPSVEGSSVAVNALDQILVDFVHNPADPADVDYDPQVTHVQLYRSVVNAGTGAVTLFEQEIPATGTGALSFTSSIADADLGEAIEIDNDPPPFIHPLTSIAIHVGRIFGVDGITNTLYFSKRFFLESFPTDFTIRQGTSSDPFTRVVAWNGNLLVFSRGSVWRLLGGDENTFVLQRTDAPTGTDAPWTIGEGIRGLYYKGFDGIYLHTGTQARNITEGKLAPLFHYQPVNGFMPMIVNSLKPFSNITRSNDVGGWFSSRYYISYATVDNGTPSNTVMYDEQTQTFYPDSRGIRRFFFDQESDNFIATFANGTAMQLESGTTDNGNAIQTIFQTHDDDEGSPVSSKQWVEGVFEVDTHTTGILTFSLVADYTDSALTVIGNLISTTKRTQLHLTANGADLQAMAWGYRIDGTGPVTIFRIIPSLHTLPPHRQSWTMLDSDLGFPVPKHLLSLWIDIEFLTATVATIILRSEQVPQVPVTMQGRRVAQDILTLTTVLDTTLFGMSITADGLFRLWDMRLVWLALPAKRRELTLIPSDLGWSGKKIMQWEALDINNISGLPIHADIVCDGQTFPTMTLTDNGRHHTGRIHLRRGTQGYLIGAHIYSDGEFQVFPSSTLGFTRVGQVGEQQVLALSPLDSQGVQQTNLLTVT